jgi:uncharacterized Tic20 family protein
MSVGEDPAVFATTMSEFSTNAQNRLVDHNATPLERSYSTWMHLSLLGNLFAPIVIFVVPLAMWLTRREDSPFIDDHGKETVNFHISLAIYMLASIPLSVVTCGLAMLLVPAAYILGIVGMIQAARAAHRGEYYRYPMTLRLVH